MHHRVDISWHVGVYFTQVGKDISGLDQLCLAITKVLICRTQQMVISERCRELKQNSFVVGVLIFQITQQRD